MIVCALLDEIGEFMRILRKTQMALTPGASFFTIHQKYQKMSKIHQTDPDPFSQPNIIARAA